jgi:RNA recognition motif-containing protein
VKKIYVGNLPFSVDEGQLRGLFEPHGEVASATIVMDRETGRPRGFGFVEMSDAGAADQAISAMNGKEVGGRALVVNEAKPREAGGGGRGGFGGGGGGRGGFGGGGGGGNRGGGGGRRW